MPLINPFTPEIIEPSRSESITQEQFDRIQKYLDCPNWICSICTSTVFGRCMKCPYCWSRNGIITARPDDYNG